MTLTCQQCAKKLSKKTARMVERRVLCSTCMFTPQKMTGAAIAPGTRRAKTAKPVEGEACQSGRRHRPDSPS